MALLRSLCDRLGELETTAQRLRDAGQMTQLGARAFALEHLQRQAELATAEATTTATRLEWKRALGLHPDAAVECLPTLTIPLHVADETVRSARLLTSPRLAALQAAHHVAERALELEVRKQWPDLTLRTGWEEEDANPRAALGLSIPLPWFTGNDPAIARAEGERDLAAEALRGGYEQLVQEHAINEARLAAARQHLLFVRQQLVPLAEQQLADAVQLAELGELDPLLILDAVVRAHHARAEAIAAAEDEALATINLNTLFTPEHDDR